MLEKILPSHEAVIHLACISNDPSYELNPKLGKSINFDAFEPLVKISRKKILIDLFMLLLHQFMELKRERCY